ncbi:hypothetical protein Ancab_026723 [Ancistrocladus abbreviatus]
MAHPTADQKVATKIIAVVFLVVASCDYSCHLAHSIGGVHHHLYDLKKACDFLNSSVEEHMNETLERLSEGAWDMPEKFLLPQLKQTAVTKSRYPSFSRIGWPCVSWYGLDEAAQRYPCSC